MATLIVTANAILYKGEVLSKDGDMPIVGYNPESSFENANDNVEDSTLWERQEFKPGAFFRRDSYYNAAGPTLLRTGSWYIENPPIISDLNPATHKLGTSVSVQINGTGFGVTAANVQVYLEFTPEYNKARLKRRDGKNRMPGTITAITDTQITATFDLDPRSDYRGMKPQTSQVLVQRLDLGLASDKLDFVIT